MAVGNQLIAECGDGRYAPLELDDFAVERRLPLQQLLDAAKIGAWRARVRERRFDFVEFGVSVGELAVELTSRVCVGEPRRLGVHKLIERRPIGGELLDERRYLRRLVMIGGDERAAVRNDALKTRAVGAQLGNKRLVFQKTSNERWRVVILQYAWSQPAPSWRASPCRTRLVLSAASRRSKPPTRRRRVGALGSGARRRGARGVVAHSCEVGDVARVPRCGGER